MLHSGGDADAQQASGGLGRRPLARPSSGRGGGASLTVRRVSQGAAPPGQKAQVLALVKRRPLLPVADIEPPGINQSIVDVGAGTSCTLPGGGSITEVRTAHREIVQVTQVSGEWPRLNFEWRLWKEASVPSSPMTEYICNWTFFSIFHTRLQRLICTLLAFGRLQVHQVVSRGWCSEGRTGAGRSLAQAQGQLTRAEQEITAWAAESPRGLVARILPSLAC